MRRRTVLAMILAMSMITVLTGCEKKESVEVSAPISKVEKVSDDVKKNAKNIVTINVTADKGWGADSTPAIAHITSKEKKVDFYHAVSPGKDGSKGTSTVELEEGRYTVEFVSPLNSDGSAYEIYDTGKAQEITVKADSKETVKIDCPMTQIPAENVTDEMVKDIVSKTEAAVEKGDDTLKGDAGKKVLETLDKNVQNSPNASDETKEDAGAVKESGAADNTEKKTDTSGTGDGTDKKAAETSGSKGSTGSSSGTGSTNSTGSTGTAAPKVDQTTQAAKPAEPAKPVHQHSWKEHMATTTVWVPNIVTVDDYETQTTVVWVCNCGAEIVGNTDSHIMAHILAGEPDNGYPEVRTNTVKVGSHTEDQGHNETSTYVDYYYCDCGATK